LVEHMLGQWNWGDEDSRKCAALRWSSVLLHELCHVVGLNMGFVNELHPSYGAPPRYADDKCSPWNIITNTYVWAMTQRIAWAYGPPACCFNFDSDFNFFSDCAPLILYPSELPGYRGPGHCVPVTVGPRPATATEWLCP
jgi:hypothetical protein